MPFQNTIRKLMQTFIGVHTLSQLATDAYESRGKIQNHINAKFSHEVLFTPGTTFGINLVANGFTSILKPGDEVLISAMEHHSNIVPWQMLCERTGAVLKVIPMNQEGRSWPNTTSYFQKKLKLLQQSIFQMH
jgi:selenocysteine lyase/cysteine desulfurase